MLYSLAVALSIHTHALVVRSAALEYIDGESAPDGMELL